jgi:serine/threonine protein kinase/tetratricopeptide (TPR) repeat protein
MSTTKDPTERVGPYRLIRELGAGGMGRVHLAHDEEEGRDVALKVLDSALSGRQGFFKRFEREAQAGLRVDHENVVRTLDYGFDLVDEVPRCYLATEYVEGRTLRELLHDLGSVPEALVRGIAKQVAAGLAAIHAASIVHRDVKPENVLITRDDLVRIMDLGVARVLDATQVLTQEGQFAGSLHYAAPEQFLGGAVGPAADLYALGVVLHELATGSNPFARDTGAEVLEAHLHETPPEVADVAPDVSPFLSELVAQLLEKDPADRFRSAQTLLEVLEQGEDSAWWAERQEERRLRTSALPRVPVRRETSLHGRDQDLALLDDLWTRAKAGGGSTLLVEGEAGIGKSRLVDAFLQGRTSEPCNVLYGSYSPAGGLGGLSDAVLGRFGASRLEAALRKHLTVSPALAPAFAALLRNEAPPVGAPGLQGDAVHAVFVQLMRSLAAEKPLVWIVEDLHFASADTWRILLSLARAVEGHRVLLVVTSRPPFPEQEAALFARSGTFRRTSLGRLGAKEVVALIRDAFRNERLVEKLGLRIAEKSDGVPFFVFEMIRGLKEGQFVTQLEDGTWVESRVIDRIEVPSAVKDLIDVRLADLTKEERALLDAGAVHGYEFDPELVAAVLERRSIAVLQDLAHVERRFGVVRPSGRRYRFDHHQIQEVVYADMAQALREGYHALLAGALESRAGAASKDPTEIDGALCVDLAEHFLQGDQGPRALRYVDAALSHLSRRNLFERSVALVDRALAVPGLVGGARRVSLLRSKCPRLGLLGRTEEEASALAEALEAADATGDAATRAHVRIDLGGHLQRLGRGSEADAVLRAAMEFARAAGDRGVEARALEAQGQGHWQQGRYAEAESTFERALSIARDVGNVAGETFIEGGMGVAFVLRGRYAEARAHFERELALARETAQPQVEVHALGQIGMVSMYEGDHAAAQACIEKALAIAREFGLRPAESQVMSHQGLLLGRLGRNAEAYETQQRVLLVERELGRRACEGSAEGNLGLVCLSMGRHAEAQAHLERQLAIVRETGDRGGEARAMANLALVLGLRGRTAKAQTLTEASLRIVREIGNQRGEAGALAGLGNLRSSLGDLVGARTHLEEALAKCRALGVPDGEGAVLRDLANVSAEEGDVATAERLAGESIALLRRLGTGDGVAHSLAQIAALRRRAGDVDGARAAADEALSLNRTQGRKAESAFLLALLATLPGGDARAAEEALADAGEEADGPGVRLLLWEATHDPAHLAEAKRRLDLLVEHAPPECRETMLANVRVNREIVAACKEAGL